MFLWKIFFPSCLFIIVDLSGTKAQHEGVPVRSAPVYPDGYPAPDSRATSRISNGRISAHLEYVDRAQDGGTHRGDITRVTSQQGRRVHTNSRTPVGDTSHTFSSTDSESTGPSGTETEFSRTRSQSFDTSGTDNTRSTYSSSPDDTRPTSGRTRSDPYSRPTLARTGSADPYSATSDRSSIASRPSHGSIPDRATSGRRPNYDSRRSYTQTGARLPYDPYATRRATPSRQPYDASARSTYAQPDRRGSIYQQCPTDNFRVLIEGTECLVAIDTLGTHVCYDDRVLRDRRCCERCLQIKNNQNPGCEYGDRARQCSTLTASQCYVRSNRNICCQTCERLKNAAQPDCEYGDLSPTCAQIPRRMCSLLENQRICCQTCDRMRDPFRPECPYGDRSSRCGVISGGACYNLRVRDTCCATCARLDVGLPGCQYGDHNAVWTSPAGELDCETYTRIYGQSACADPNFSSRCCQSCRSYVPRNTQS